MWRLNSSAAIFYAVWGTFVIFKGTGRGAFDFLQIMDIWIESNLFVLFARSCRTDQIIRPLILGNECKKFVLLVSNARMHANFFKSVFHKSAARWIVAQAPDDVINSNGDLAFGKQMTLSVHWKIIFFHQTSTNAILYIRSRYILQAHYNK